MKSRAHRVAAELVKGASATKALIAAGYSPHYANSWGYRVIQQPEIQSLVTEALREAGLTMQQVIQPYLQGLQAKKSQRVKEPIEESDIADLEVRMAAADRICRLMGQIPSAPDYPDPPAPPCEIHIHSERDRPAPSPAPAQPEPRSSQVSGRPTMQQAVIINVRSERDRPR
jgi:terminase small subunit-like protein